MHLVLAHLLRAVARPSTLVVAVLAASLALSAAANAASHAIHACVKPRSGATRIVGARAKCHDNEKKLSWSTTGPEGKGGKPGAPGAAGAEGTTVGFQGADGTAHPIGDKAAVTVVSKTLPPGSYLAFGKTQISFKEDKADLGVATCELGFAAGTAGSGELQVIDATIWEGPLGEFDVKEFVAAVPLDLRGTFTSTVTTTLKLICFGLSGQDFTSQATTSQVHALALSRIG